MKIKKKLASIILISGISLGLFLNTNINAEGLFDFLSGKNPHESEYGKFVLTGEMNYPRYGHLATLLQDGRVLISGGGPPEIYNFTTGKFSLATNCTLNVKTADLLNNGKVFFTGYYGAHIYDPTKNIFQIIEGLPEEPSYRFVKVLDDDRVFIHIKKYIDVESKFEQTLEKENYRFEYTIIPHEYKGRKWNGYELDLAFIYSPTQNQITRLSNQEKTEITSTIPEYSEQYKNLDKLGYWQKFSINKNIYFVQFREENKFFLYDFLQDKLEPIDSLPQARIGIGYSCIRLNDYTMLLMGGADPNIFGPSYKDAYILDIKNKKFDPAGSMFFVHCAPAETLLKNGNILISGGSKHRLGSNKEYAPAELFIPNIVLKKSIDLEGETE